MSTGFTLSIGIFSILCTFSCTQTSLIKKDSLVDLAAIAKCQGFIESHIGKILSGEIDRVYIDKFPDGLIVAFTEGEVGTFGKRDEHYRQHWACGISDGIVLKASSPFEEPILDSKEPLLFEKYDVNVIEKLYLKENGEYKFCCKQTLKEFQE
jgi:hypothetical protein